jgi:hypothetical protein
MLLLDKASILRLLLKSLRRRSWAGHHECPLIMSSAMAPGTTLDLIGAYVEYSAPNCCADRASRRFDGARDPLEWRGAPVHAAGSTARGRFRVIVAKLPLSMRNSALLTFLRGWKSCIIRGIDETLAQATLC